MARNTVRVRNVRNVPHVRNVRNIRNVRNMCGTPGNTVRSQHSPTLSDRWGKGEREVAKRKGKHGLGLGWLTDDADFVESPIH